MGKINLNILIVGVGGQGSLIATKILGNIAMALNLQCKSTEIHGMSQRGGSVSTHLKIGEIVYSPVICEGDVDALISFELMETLRWVHYLKSKGTVIYSDFKINPLSVITGDSIYPKINANTFLDKDLAVVHIDAHALKEVLGGTKGINMVLIGAFCKRFNIDIEIPKQAVRDCFTSQRIVDMNVKAIEIGYTY